MKSLQESLFDLNIQITESLFDNDLVEKGVSIDFETLRDMLFNFGRKRTRLFNKCGVDYREGIQSIYIKKSFSDTDDYEVDDAVYFELEFCVTNVYIDTKDGEKLTPAFNVPQLKVAPTYNNLNKWKSSKSDYAATVRAIDKKYDFRKEDTGIVTHTTTLKVTNNDNVRDIFNMLDGMVKYFCSDDFDKVVEDYIKKFKHQHEIPGLIMDILMKKLINKS